MQNLCRENNFYLHVHKKQSNLYMTALYSGHPVYYGHRTTFQKLIALYFLHSWPVYISGHSVYNAHIAISQGWPLYTGLTAFSYQWFRT